jgi:hypothetical protein
MVIHKEVNILSPHDRPTLNSFSTLIVDMPAPTGPSLQRIDASDIEGLKQAIVDDGAVIIKTFTTAELVDQVNEDTRSYLDTDKPSLCAMFPPETRRCVRLI